MSERRAAFEHSTPDLYDRYMGPLLFEPYARVVAERVAALQPKRVLETATGTGILTRAVSKAVPQAEIVATDLNPAVLDFAAARLQSARVSFRAADAQELPFSEHSFDLALCQFGVMFMPDKIRANREAARVINPDGAYLLVTFDRLDLNPVPQAAGEAVAKLFPDDPPRYMEEGPFSYTDPGLIEDDLRAAGFTKIELDAVALSTAVNASEAAYGLVLGSPFRAEIERRDPEALDRALDAVTEALRRWDGNDAPMSAHVVTARP